MNEQVQLFKYQHDNVFDNIRTIEIKGEIWFVGSDVAGALGYKRPSEAVRQHCKEKGTVKHRTLTQGGPQELLLINEPNVYRLIVKSSLPSAEQFEGWLFEEVIPSIRKTGTYGIDRYERPNFIVRYFENFDRIEQGYFSVITELYVRLYARLEHAGYKIPNKSVTGQEIRPDVSVGKCFAAYLKANFPSAPTEFKTYQHAFQNGLEVPARLYPIELISIFIRYVDEIWIPKNAEAYFMDKRSKGVGLSAKIANPSELNTEGPHGPFPFPIFSFRPATPSSAVSSQKLTKRAFTATTLH